MSFDNSPQIDQSAKYSERSERKMRETLNLDSGSLCKSENPDMGCDFSVELVLDSANSSSLAFSYTVKKH
jgi:hypothetical protein